MSMHRELNPQLFGNQSQVEKMGAPVDPLQPAANLMGRGADAEAKVVAGASARATAFQPSEIKALEHQISTLRLTLMQTEKRAEGTGSKLEDLARTVHGRLERFSQAILRLEDMQSKQNQEVTGKFAQVLQKVNERKISDIKVQELIDRHNTVIRNFENRLLSLQRVLSEQEMALHNTQAALEEARAELGKRRS